MATLLHGTMIQNVWIYDMQRRNFLKLLGGIAAVGALPTLPKGRHVGMAENHRKNYGAIQSKNTLIYWHEMERLKRIGTTNEDGTVPHSSASYGKYGMSMISAGDIMLLDDKEIMLVTDIKVGGLIGTII